MVEAAPYKFVYTTSTVDGKEVKLYYLGKFGKELVEKAASRDLVYERTRELNEKLLALIDIIGEENIIQHFKQQFLDSLKTKAYRRYELVGSPFYLEKSEALNRLLDEKQVVKTGNAGWFKLANPQKVEA